MKIPWAKARVLEASDRNYSAAVVPLLETARKEIVMSFYLIEPNDTAASAHPVNRLMESLIAARKRGVRVQLYLNTNFRFVPKSGVASGGYFERLIESGAEVTTLLPGRRLHDKLIVIDSRYVVEGSMNWSVSALMTNFESATVIDSVTHARKKLARIAGLTQPRVHKPSGHATDIDRPLLPVPQFVELSVVLFEKNYLPAMSRTSDMRAFDLYLMIVGQAAAAGKNDLELDLEAASRALGLPKEWSRSTLRRQMIKVLKKLADGYKLLSVEFPYGRDAKIKLTDFPNERIQVPGWLFEAGYLGGATTTETFLALAKELLKKEGADIDSLSAPELERRFGIGTSTTRLARKKN